MPISHTFSTYIYTHTYICMVRLHGPDAGVPEQARFSGMHACMHVRTYAYVYTWRCKYIYIKIFKRSKQMTFRQAKTLFTYTQTMCTCTHAHSIRSWRHGHMQTGERRQARHICAVCLVVVHSYVCFACVRRNACNMHVYISIYLYSYIHVSVYMRMYTCMYVCIFIYICMYIRTQTQWCSGT